MWRHTESCQRYMMERSISKVLIFLSFWFASLDKKDHWEKDNCTIHLVIYLDITPKLLLYYNWVVLMNSVLPGGCLYQKPSHPAILSERHTSLTQYHPDGILERRNIVNKSYPLKYSNIIKYFPSYYCTAIVTTDRKILVRSDYLSNSISNDTGKYAF